MVKQLGIEASEVIGSKKFVDDFNADSLELAEFVIKVEEKFDISIPNEYVENIKTVQDALDVLFTKVSK